MADQPSQLNIAFIYHAPNWFNAYSKTFKLLYPQMQAIPIMAESVITLEGQLELLSRRIDAIILPLSLPECASLRLAEIVHVRQLPIWLILLSVTSLEPEVILKLFDVFLKQPAELQQYENMFKTIAVGCPRREGMSKLELNSAIENLLEGNCFKVSGEIGQVQSTNGRHGNRVTPDQYRLLFQGRIEAEPAPTDELGRTNLSASLSMMNDLEPIQRWLPTLSPQRLRDDDRIRDAVSAVTAAALETRKALYRYRNKHLTPSKSESKLCDLWRQAGLALLQVDQNLARRCLQKADYWADPSTWTRQRVESADIVLDDVYDAGLNLINKVTFVPGTDDNVPTIAKLYGEEDLERVTVGILTALPKEFSAVKQVLANGNEVIRRGTGSGRRYWIAEVSSADSKKHLVGVAQLVSMANNVGAARATQFLEHCPNTRALLVVGIAGAVPDPDKAEVHVRLGDIVASNAMGVIQYDLVKRTRTFEEMRHPPRPPSAELIEALNALESTELEGHRPWDLYAAQAIAALGWTRPGDDSDVLQTPGGRRTIPHPDDPDRLLGKPRVFRGPIASANKLLKDPVLRDALREKFGVKAVEMEASGVADATWLQDRGYFVIRGTCDYCDKGKGNAWQKYASIIAAAYARTLLEHLPAVSGSHSVQAARIDNSDAERLGEMVQVLDSRRIFYEIEENIEFAKDSVLNARDTFRGIARGKWTDGDAQTWAEDIQSILADFLTDIDRLNGSLNIYEMFYRKLDVMREDLYALIRQIILKYPRHIRVRNLPLSVRGP